MARTDVDPNLGRFWRSDNREAPLDRAVSRADAAMVRILLQRRDVNPNASRPGRFPLVEAAARGRREIVRLLLERDDIDANMNMWSASCEIPTPLWAAAFNGHAHVVQLLLARDDV